MSTRVRSIQSIVAPSWSRFPCTGLFLKLISSSAGLLSTVMPHTDPETPGFSRDLKLIVVCTRRAFVVDSGTCYGGILHRLKLGVNLNAPAQIEAGGKLQYSFGKSGDFLAPVCNIFSRCHIYCAEPTGSSEPGKNPGADGTQTGIYTIPKCSRLPKEERSLSRLESNERL